MSGLEAIYAIFALFYLVVLVCSIGIAVIIYIIDAIALSRMAEKTGNGDSVFLAWIPILNILLKCKIAALTPWSALLIFIPFVNLLYLFALNVCLVNRFLNPKVGAALESLADIKPDAIFMGLAMTVPLIESMVMYYYGFIYIKKHPTPIMPIMPVQQQYMPPVGVPPVQQQQFVPPVQQQFVPPVQQQFVPPVQPIVQPPIVQPPVTNQPAPQPTNQNGNQGGNQN
jgi:hypothetical protein